MSLVTDVFDFVKTNPGVDGMKIQNHFLNNIVSESISELETQNAIKWTFTGYYPLKEELNEFNLSLDDCIDEIEKIIKDRKFKECPKCHVSAEGNDRITQIFGFRNDKGKVIPQSYCRKCRRNHGKGTQFQYTTDFVSVRKAKTLKDNINIEGIIIQKQINREFLPLSGCHKLSCTAFLVDDHDDSIKIRLWYKDVKRIKNGSRIRIMRAHTAKFLDETILTIDSKKGLLEVVYYGEREKSKNSFSFKPKPERFSFENCIVESSDDILKIDSTENISQRRDDLKF